MEYSSTKLQEAIDDKVQKKQRQPRFYVISGSYMRGYSTEESDIDIIGFHTTPPDSYSYLFKPEGEISVETQVENKTVEIRSYELRKFCKMIVQANFRIIESIICGEQVMNGMPLEIEALKSLINNSLPLNVPNTYFGMAKSNYYSGLDRNKKSSYDPKPKNFIHVYRSLIAAKYTSNYNNIISDVTKLAQEVSEANEDIINELIKCRKQNKKVDSDLENRIHNEISYMFNVVEPPESPDKQEFKQEIDKWMRKVR
mgnify:CR=1 FL=1